jgi:hypothetical protein
MQVGWRCSRVAGVPDVPEHVTSIHNLADFNLRVAIEVRIIEGSSSSSGDEYGISSKGTTPEFHDDPVGGSQDGSPASGENVLSLMLSAARAGSVPRICDGSWRDTLDGHKD